MYILDSDKKIISDLKTDHIRHEKKQKSTLELFVIMLTQSVALWSIFLWSMIPRSLTPLSRAKPLLQSSSQRIYATTGIRPYRAFLTVWKQEFNVWIWENYIIVQIFDVEFK